MEKSTPLISGHYYHLYNRGNNRENIFIEERNYEYFLKLYSKNIEPVAETFAYCLLRNHFHFLIRVRTEFKPPDVGIVGQPFAGSEPAKGLITPQVVSRRFANLFNSYAQAINKAYNRTGALFQKRFGRILVENERYFRALIYYIHFNPQKHGFVNDFRAYPYSSYAAFISTKPTRLNRAEVLNLFGGLEAFAQFHQEIADEKSIQPLIEDDEV